MQSRFTRRTAIAALSGAAGATLVRFPASAAQFEYKFAHTFPLNHPYHTRQVEMWNAVKTETNGRLSVTVFGNSVLGNDLSVIQEVRTGAIQFIGGFGANLASIAPVAAVEGLGFAFKSSQDAFVAMDGALGQLVQSQLEAKGLYTFPTAWDVGMRQVTSNVKPIVAAADFAGLKLRVVTSKISVSLFEALGASPTPLPFIDTYASLQSHVIDGQETPLPVIEGAKFYEVQKYLAITNHQWGSAWTMASSDAIASLPLDVRTVVRTNVTKYGLLQRKDMVDLDQALAAKLRSRGMTVTTVDAALLRPKLKGYYAMWKREFGDVAWGLLEKAVGRLGD